MPVFNHTEELKTMIDSIVANSFQDWELLAVDDGSDEATKDVLRHYAEQDNRITFVYRERTPKGAQTCRNIGLEQARGEYVVFFDSDDYVAPYCLEQRVKEMDQRPELDFMVFRSGTYSNHTFHQAPSKFNYGYPIYSDDTEAFCARTLPFIVWNNIYRRSSLVKYNICWDTHLLSLQDGLFNLTCLLKGLRYAYATLPPDYGYRTESTGSVSKKILSAAHYESHLYATRQSCSLVQEHYGHHYDKALYRGAMFIYVKVSRTGIQKEFNLKLASVVRSFSASWGTVLLCQVRLTYLLGKVLPLNMARRLPILNYLMWFRRAEHRMVTQQKKLA